MKSILIILFTFLAFAEFNSIFRNTSDCGKNIIPENFVHENLTFQNQLEKGRANHRVNHKSGNFLRIEFITNDYTKEYEQVNNSSLSEAPPIDYKLVFNCKKFNQLNIFLPFFNQSQKLIQSEFLLI